MSRRFELTGDAVLVTIGVGEARICAKGDRHRRSDIGERLSLRLDPRHCHLFDGKSGMRIEQKRPVPA